jgi:hypothetical protein
MRSPNRLLVSAFLGWHCLAIALGALPNPGALPKVEPRKEVATPLVSWLDATASAFAVVPRALSGASRMIRPATSEYLRLTGLAQQWQMFGNPPTYDEYLRVRFYVADQQSAKARWVATQLIMPTSRENGVRVLSSYRDSYQDKAFAIALQRFFEKRKPELIAPDTAPAALPDELAPIVRYYARQFAERSLGPNERIVRSELWYGRAPNPVPGAALDSAAHAARMNALFEYYDGPVEDRVLIPPEPPYHAAERQGDLQWLLEYYEVP